MTAGELASIPRSRLAPTALFMTALVRLAGCDLFIHGLGGGAYDAIAEEWAGEWLGEELAPMGVVTATVRLPLRGAGASERDVARAAWLAHRARHDPALLGDAESAGAKARMLGGIAAMESGPARAAAYRSMHALLARAREARAARLEALDRDVDRARALLAGRAIALDRTWPFPLHGEAALEDLRRAVADRFAPARSGAQPAKS